MLTLEERLAALEAMVGPPPAPAPRSVNPDGSPGHVAPNELIESAWGNAVVDSLPYARIGYQGDPGVLSPASLLIQCAVNVFTTDYYGDFSIPFPSPFAPGNVVVLAVNAEPSAQRHYNVRSPSTTGVTMFAALVDGTPARDSQCAVAWYAIGRNP